jgi:NAD(P)-dependent dehydrogenase (short-subunit alcohol dehydrogenase family)
VARRYERLDILVNNLGVYGVKAFEEITDGDWRAIIETDIVRRVRFSSNYLPKMKQAGLGADWKKWPRWLCALPPCCLPRPRAQIFALTAE